MSSLTKIAKTLSEFDEKIDQIVKKKLEEASELIDVAEREGRSLEEKKKEVIDEIKELVSKAKMEEMEKIKEEKLREKEQKLAEIEEKAKENYNKAVETAFISLMRELEK